VFRHRLLLWFILILLSRCAAPPVSDLAGTARSAWLDQYVRQSESLRAVDWNGYISVLSRRSDQLTLPYHLHYATDKVVDTLDLTVSTPFGTPLIEIRIVDDKLEYRSGWPSDDGLPLPLGGADSLEITAADAYSYFWAVPWLETEPGVTGVGVSFDDRNQPARIVLDETGTRWLDYAFRQLPGIGIWPRSIRYTEQDELQITITVKEPEKYDSDIGSDSQL